MKITVYTITDCQFSKAEKEYLAAHNLPYEEKNLEQNREWLTEMLAVSNNFAGTPVTKIEKDDGKIEVLKGFTPEEFDEVLGFSKPAADQPTPAQATVAPPPPPPSPAPTTANQQPTTNPQSLTTDSQSPTTNHQSPTTNNNDPLNSILADLQAKAVDQPSTPPMTENQQPTTDNQQPITNFNQSQPVSTNPSKSMPSIPDFSDKTT